eukprot:6214791-Pleurochrysis_carterae.AAC.9
MHPHEFGTSSSSDVICCGANAHAVTQLEGTQKSVSTCWVLVLFCCFQQLFSLFCSILRSGGQAQLARAFACWRQGWWMCCTLAPIAARGIARRRQLAGC